jgi:hypothetical protein
MLSKFIETITIELVKVLFAYSPSLILNHSNRPLNFVNKCEKFINLTGYSTVYENIQWKIINSVISVCVSRTLMQRCQLYWLETKEIWMQKGEYLLIRLSNAPNSGGVLMWRRQRKRVQMWIRSDVLFFVPVH